MANPLTSRETASVILIGGPYGGHKVDAFNSPTTLRVWGRKGWETYQITGENIYEWHPNWTQGWAFVVYS
jgi:hypothetical protein